MSGTCKPNEQEKRASEPLSISQVKNNPKFSSIHKIVLTFFFQFLSAFLLLGIGSLISVVLFFLEHLYMSYVKNHIGKVNDPSKASACCSLISQVKVVFIFTKIITSFQIITFQSIGQSFSFIQKPPAKVLFIFITFLQTRVAWFNFAGFFKLKI